MESNFVNRPDDAPSAEEAARALHTLGDDRERMAEGIRVPWPLLAAFGGVAAWWVSAAAGTTPGEDFHAPTTGWLGLVAVLLIAHLVQREVGVRFRGMGATATWALLGILAICLLLFSVSLGLVSLGATWAVSLTALAAFGITTWLAGLAYRSAAERIGRG
ncbi:hypothetical protein [Leucobacter sp. M11]|uniref:hypothetical protein n=1 Tax=Leucobacter sp. M11 TaxID=2993565 RepID=UPI002D7E43D3|nr:hypothetical protein [Leucobacter sp. M11]MEB4615549.1 hypothetical protein [Leucobacter sp. M11]